MATSLIARNNIGALTRRDPARLALFKKTVGKDLVGTEIDEAIEFCELYGANPFVRDIYFFVFGKVGEADRKVAPVLSIGLYRKIAARSGNYRPDDRPARFEYDKEREGPDNPRGIVSCEVTVYRYAHGEWFPITERLRWEERAPIIEGCPEGYSYEDDGVWPDTGKPKKKRVPKGPVMKMLNPKKGNWLTMPETMLAKCTEAAGIRKGWPNETSGSYVEGELDATPVIELTATEIIANQEQDERTARIGGKNTVLVDWCDGNALQAVPTGKLYDAAMAFIAAHMHKGHEEAGHVLAWEAKNAEGLRQFWALEKDAALSLKKRLEQVAAFHKAGTTKPL